MINFYDLPFAKYTTGELLANKAHPIPAKQTNNPTPKTKECICCDRDLELTKWYDHPVNKKNKPRLDRRLQVCKDCMKTEEGRRMNIYRAGYPRKTK